MQSASFINDYVIIVKMIGFQCKAKNQQSVETTDKRRVGTLELPHSNSDYYYLSCNYLRHSLAIYVLADTSHSRVSR